MAKNLTDLQHIAVAAAKWHVPVGILWGVYGIESSFGTDNSTSSAGAQGPFQFIPSTARQYHLSNPNNLDQSADAAAHYLHDLYGQSHSWDAALHSYSGGGYGLEAVQKKGNTGEIPGGAASAAGGAVQGAADNVTSAVSDTASALPRIADVLTGFFNVLTSPDAWLRIGAGLVGLVLIYEGLRGLTGQGPGITELAGHAQRAAKTVGEASAAGAAA